jgi:homoserine kinase
MAARIEKQVQMIEALLEDKLVQTPRSRVISVASSAEGVARQRALLAAA